MIWQSMVRQWLRQQATAKVLHAARGGNEPPPARQDPADVGLVYALGIELGGLEDLLSGLVVTRGSQLIARQGSLQGRDVVLMQSGVGMELAAHGTQALLRGHRPGWVIAAGFAGGLDPALRRGDILMVDTLCDPSGRRLSIDLKVDPQSLASQPGIHVGTLLSVDEIIHRPADKQALGHQHGALAVDMESWAVGEVCRQAKVRFMAIRIITDALEDELPEEVERLARQKSTAARLGAAAGALFRRPSSIKDMIKLKGEAMAASDRLARFLAGIIVRLAPEKTPSRQPGPSDSEPPRSQAD